VRLLEEVQQFLKKRFDAVIPIPPPPLDFAHGPEPVKGREKILL